MPTAEEVINSFYKKNLGGCLDMDSFDNEVDMFISNQNRKLMDLKMKDNVSLFASETKPECSEVDIVTDHEDMNPVGDISNKTSVIESYGIENKGKHEMADVSYAYDDYPSIYKRHKANKHILPKKPELNDDMYNWVIAKYGKPTEPEKAEPEKSEPEKAEAGKAEAETAEPEKPDVPECSKKAVVQECSNIKEKEDQQDVYPDTAVIVIGSSSSKLECSSTLELECSSILESSSSDESSSSELSSYVSSYDESSSSNESSCLEKSDEEETDKEDEEIDKQDDEIDDEAKDGKDDSHDELWSP
ncbi:hypothetical protein Tco_1358261, partial [Tanacetum coccineum]